MSKKILELAMIAALTPANEEKFSAEVVNEGVWLTEAHMLAIENKLSADATAIKTAGDALTAATTAKDTAEASLKTANDTIAANKTEIDNLKAENEKLKKPAAAATSSAPGADAGTDEVKDPKAKYRMGVDATAEQYATKK